MDRSLDWCLARINMESVNVRFLCLIRAAFNLYCNCSLAGLLR